MKPPLGHKYFADGHPGKICTTIGIDLAKNGFSLYGVNAKGRCGLWRALTRSGIIRFFIKLPEILFFWSQGGVTYADRRRRGTNILHPLVNFVAFMESLCLIYSCHDFSPDRQPGERNMVRRDTLFQECAAGLTGIFFLEQMNIENVHLLCKDLPANPCSGTVARRTCSAGKRQSQT
jgi:hypothetical protein